MEKEQNRKKAIQRYIDTIFRCMKILQAIITFNALQKIKQEDTDLFINEATGEISYKPQKGKRKYFSKGIPGLGWRGWRLLLDVVWAAGEWVELDSANHVNAMILRLRRAFEDNGSDQWFFETRRNPTYAIRWNPNRSWRFIEKKA